MSSVLTYTSMIGSAPWAMWHVRMIAAASIKWDFMNGMFMRCKVRGATFHGHDCIVLSGWN